MNAETLKPRQLCIRRLPLTRMQAFVMSQRLDGQSPRQIADLIGVGIAAIYQRDHRGRKRLSRTQRTGYVNALKANGGRRVKIRPLSLSFTRE
jgi:DNA-directed RNA polymerase specialized sigma24 family protein